MEEEQPSHSRVSWGPVSAVFGTIIIYFASQIVAVMLLSLYPLSQHWNDAQTNDWYDHSLYAQFGLGLLVDALSFQMLVIFLRKRHAQLRALGLKWPQWRDVGYALSGYVVYFATYILVFQAITTYITNIDVDQKQELGFNTVGVGGYDLVFVFVSLVILPPLIEELLVRGFLYTGLRSKLPKITAALLTSLIFAFAHLQLGSGNPPLYIAAVDTFLLSLVLVYLREKTGSLAAPMLLHATKNGIAFATLFIFHLG